MSSTKGLAGCIKSYLLSPYWTCKTSSDAQQPAFDHKLNTIFASDQTRCDKKRKIMIKNANPTSTSHPDIRNFIFHTTLDADEARTSAKGLRPTYKERQPETPLRQKAKGQDMDTT